MHIYINTLQGGRILTLSGDNLITIQTAPDIQYGSKGKKTDPVLYQKDDDFKNTYEVEYLLLTL